MAVKYQLSINTRHYLRTKPTEASHLKEPTKRQSAVIMAVMNVGMLTTDAIQTSLVNGWRKDQTSTSNFMGIAMVQ